MLRLWTSSFSSLFSFSTRPSLSDTSHPVAIHKSALHDAPSLPPDFTLAAASQTATVARGQSATYTLSVTPQNGFNTAVSLSCSGLPAGATCSFTPNPLTPAGSAATSTLTISTTAASAGILLPAFKPITPIYALWLPLSALGLLGLVVLGRKPTRKSWLPSREAALFLVVLFALVLGIACGGSSNPSAGNSAGSGGSSSVGTPVGTYTVVVTGASGSLQKTTSLSLTVQ